MKRIVLLLIATGFLFVQGFSQSCTPDSTLLASGALGPVPLPDTTGGLDTTLGISTPICQGQPWAFQFNIVVPDSVLFDVGFGPEYYDLIHIAIPDTLAFLNLPSGLDYVCDPPNCVFVDDSVGCVQMYGTTFDSAGVDTIIINGALRVVFGGAPVEFPFNFPIPGIADGVYLATIYEPGTGPCPLSSIDESQLPFQVGELFPNPVVEKVALNLTTETAGEYAVQIFDLAGAEVMAKQYVVPGGENTLSMDVSKLPEGVYFCVVGTAEWQVVRKMVKM